MRAPIPFALAVCLALSLLANVHASTFESRPFGAKERTSPRSERFGVARMDGYLDRLLSGKTNEACLRSHVTRLEFEGLPKYSSTTNYCDVPVKDLPRDALAVIEKAGELNAKVAALLGQKPEETYVMDVSITISGDVKGSLGSEAKGGKVVLSALPDWTFQDFSSTVYAHEIIHTLTFNAGPTSEALLGLQDHPFLTEGLADLISTAIHDVPKIVLGEAALPKCIREIRNETPIRTLAEPFGRFHTLASANELVRCCATLDLEKVAPFARGICNQFTWGQSTSLATVETFIQENGLSATPYDEAHLAAAFEAKDCRVETKTGLVYLDNCDPHQFGYPLVSFFFRLKELTGSFHVTEFFEKIREGSRSTAVYECGYSAPTVTPKLGGAKAYVALRPLLGPFLALRESLNSADRSAFDRVWKEHHFGKLVDLDRIYRNETLSGVAQIVVKAKNLLYRDLEGCENPYKFDPATCSVACEKKL